MGKFKYMDFYNQENYSISDIENLIKNEVEESVHLDYKEARSLTKTDKARIDITKDISSFANANGGIIVYGISEVNHKPQEISPIDGRIYTKEWLEDVIQMIQPRIDGLKIYPIRIDGSIEKSLYIVRIPRSANAPHMARDKRYYKRINFESVPMEDYEVKDTYNRVVTPNLVIENCAFYIEEDKSDYVTYHLFAAVLNRGNRACELYKVNFYINNAAFCDITYKTLEDKNSFTIIDHNRIKLSSSSQSPIFPNEKIDMGHFHITVKKQYLIAFWQNLVIDMILYYIGGQEDIAFIPSTGQFITGRENIIKALKARQLQPIFMNN